jgi:hypothetical protein
VRADGPKAIAERERERARCLIVATSNHSKKLSLLAHTVAFDPVPHLSKTGGL